MEDYFTKLKVEDKMRKALADHPWPSMAFKVAVPLCSSVKTRSGKTKRFLTDLLIWDSAEGARLKDVPDSMAGCTDGIDGWRLEAASGLDSDEIFPIQYEPDGKILPSNLISREWMISVTSCDPIKGSLEILCMKPWIQFTLNAADRREVEDKIDSGNYSSLFSRPLEYRGSIDSEKCSPEKIGEDWMLLTLEAGKKPRAYGLSYKGKQECFKLGSSPENSQLPMCYQNLLDIHFAAMEIGTMTALTELCERWLDQMPETLLQAIKSLWTLPPKKQTPKQAEKKKLFDSLERFVFPQTEKEKLQRYIADHMLGCYGTVYMAWPCLDENQHLIFIGLGVNQFDFNEKGRGICDFQNLLWTTKGGYCSTIGSVSWLRSFQRNTIFIPGDVLADLLAGVPGPFSEMAAHYRLNEGEDPHSHRFVWVKTFQSELKSMRRQYSEALKKKS